MKITPKDQVDLCVANEQAECQLTLHVGEKARRSSPLAYKVWLHVPREVLVYDRLVVCSVCECFLPDS